MKDRQYILRIFEREITVKPLTGKRKSNGVKENNLHIAHDGSVCEESDPADIPTRSAGDITKFSNKSRSRLFKVFRRLQTKALYSPVFYTLTARPDLMDPEELQKKFLKLFLPWLRDDLGGMHYLWRLELHASGFIHYHLIVWPIKKDVKLTSEYWKRRSRKAWRKLIGDNSRASELHSCKIRDIQEVDQLGKYISKYMAKEDDQNCRPFSGRRWGVSKDLPLKPITEIIVTPADEKELWKFLEQHFWAMDRPEIVAKIREWRAFGWSLWVSFNELTELLEICNLKSPLELVRLYYSEGPEALYYANQDDANVDPPANQQQSLVF